MSIELARLRNAVAKHGRVVRVVVAQVRGSAPREVGTAMLVWPGGQEGTIGGGTLEHEATQAALSHGDHVRRVALGPDMGQCCGGAVVLISEAFDAARLEELGEVFVRRVEGTGDMPLAMRRAMAAARASGTPVEAAFEGGWMIEPVAAARRALWIYGAGHVGRALVAVMAPLPDFEITWVDTDAARYPDVMPEGVTQLGASNPADVVAHAPRDAEHLIVTFSHALDLELCHRVLSHGFGFAGLIGSHTKWARFRSRLGRLGHSDAQISRICCPIGQPELGKHPQAIAVGVAASLVSRHGNVESKRDIVG